MIGRAGLAAAVEHAADGIVITGPDGRIEYVNPALLKRDVTGRRGAEEARRFLAAIVEYSEDAILASTPEGVIVTWNRGAEAIFGHSAEDAIGKPVSMLMAPGRLPDLARFTGQLLRGIAASQFESVCQRKDGREFPISVTGRPS